MACKLSVIYYPVPLPTLVFFFFGYITSTCQCTVYIISTQKERGTQFRIHPFYPYMHANGRMLNGRIAAPNTSRAHTKSHPAHAPARRPSRPCLPRARDRMRGPERERPHSACASVAPSAPRPGTCPTKNAISRAATCSASVSVAICSGGGSGNSSGFSRVSEVSRTCAYYRYGPVSPSNDVIRSQSKL